MKTILVTGDFLIDHHIYEGQRHHFGDQSSRGVCVTEELGGAAIVHRLLQHLQTGRSWESVLAIDSDAALTAQTQCDAAGAGCQEQPFAAYAFWRPHPTRGKNSERRWRVAEAMGFGGGPASSGEWPWRAAEGLPTEPEVLVISDGGMGFRSRMNLDNWRVPVRDWRLRELACERLSVNLPPLQEPRWIVLKVSAPVGQGDLWRELSTYHADRLVVIVAANELRRAEVRLGQALSWEQTLEDVFQALTSNQSLRSLAQCRHLVITFESEGVLWLSNETDSRRRATFLFDSAHVEGESRQEVAGTVYGHLSCLTATLAAELAENTDEPDLATAMLRGVVAMRRLREYGHGDASKRGAGFPAAELASAACQAQASGSLQIRKFDVDPANSPVRPGWSLVALHESPLANQTHLPLVGIAHRVLIQGPASLLAPTMRIGDFFTADRGEIEAVRSLRQLVHRYVEDRNADKPLSIGVFGPPGAGKSFAVKQLSKSLLGDRLGWLEFNLSQFNDALDLIGALHQVRDKVLEGKMPVAFFDEFDSQNFRWLKYLLAPMQDGRFQEGQISHPVGQCLFVFAGGTSHTYESFAAKGDPQGPAGKKAADDFVLAKGPDFASRLDGRLNVVGPNPRSGGPSGDVDIFCPVRRALFIRARLRCSDSERLKIHNGLATALLEVPKYRHGARSLAKLLEPYCLQRRSHPDAPLGLSSLLPPGQIELHVDREEFEQLTRRGEEIANQLGIDRLAAAVHDFYRQKAKRENWLKPQHDCDFADLAPFDQASNREAARRVPAVLALAGLKLVGTRTKGGASDDARQLLDFHIDLLAEAEHDGWMDWHLENGWTQDANRQDAFLRHNRLVPYAQLPAEEQRKDQDAVRHYPDIAELAGMLIVSKLDADASTVATEEQ